MAYVDFEDDENGIGSRLLDFNGDGPTLVVLDGVTEGYGLHGWKIDGNDDSPKWRRGYVKPATRTGAAVLSSDHVVKNKENRNGFAIGAQHKKAGLTGVLFGLENVTPFGRGLLGRSRLLIYKDRPAGLRQHGVRTDDGWTHFADLVVDGRNDGLTLDGPDPVLLEIRPPVQAADGGQDDVAAKLREVIDRIKDVLTARGALTARDLRAAVRGRAKEIDEAVQYMITAGELHEGEMIKGSAKRRHLPDQCAEGFKCFSS